MNNNKPSQGIAPRSESTLRSRGWFDDPSQPDKTALYLERYTNFGISAEALHSDRPIIGIAQTGSDLAPCNRHHMILAERLRDGIREAGGIALEFPVHPIQETGKSPTAALDRNLAYLGLVEILFGYPIDGVVLTIGCDKTTAAALMAAATVNIPSIALSVGPMLNGGKDGRRVGSGSIIWESRQHLATGELGCEDFIELVMSSTQSSGFCNTMGTAMTMNVLTEVLGMSLPGSSVIPAPYRERQQCAFQTGRQIVEMVRADRKPSDILRRQSFLNAIRVCTAIGGSTNAPVHVNAVARHAGIELTMDDWQEYGSEAPLLVNVRPAGEYLAEDFHCAGGVRAVVAELMRGKMIVEDSLTVNGRTLGENCSGAQVRDCRVIRSVSEPLRARGGFIVMGGNIFDSAIMNSSVISDAFRERYLSDVNDPDAFEGNIVVFEGPEDYRNRIDDPGLKATDKTILVMRGTGVAKYPGSADVVNMRAPGYLMAAGISELPCIGDGRQSETSGTPQILNVSPEAAAGGTLALLQTGDRVRIDLKAREVNVLLEVTELIRRRRELEQRGGYQYPRSQTPWQELHREKVGQLATGAVLEPAAEYQCIAQVAAAPRHSH